MGKVTEELLARVRRQVEDQGIVVWFDPEGQYADVVGQLEESGTSVLAFEDSYFKLRHELEPHLSTPARPRLVLYLQRSETAAAGPMAEAIAAGVVIKPGQQPAIRNTRLAVVARAALSSSLPPTSLESILRQVEDGLLSLEDLDRIGEEGGGVAAGTLNLIFETSNPLEIALVFVSSEIHDEAIVKKNALDELTSLLSVEYGSQLGSSSSPDDVRRNFRRYLFGVELLSAFEADPPETFRFLPKPDRSQHLKNARLLLNTWRNRRDLQSYYADAADIAEKELGLYDLPLENQCLERLVAFKACEMRLQIAVEEYLLNEPDDRWVQIAETRRESFWSSLVPEILDRWVLIGVLGRLLIKGKQVKSELKADAFSLKEMTVRYCVEGESPGSSWSALDSLHRQMERRFHLFELDVTGGHESLEKLVAKARASYARAANVLAERFLRALNQAGFSIDGVPRQVEVFHQFVEPSLASGKTALLLVDGLRFEMARELQSESLEDYQGELSWALGTLPSITAIGMGAVLPRAHEGLELVAAGKGKVAVRLGNRTLRNRKERLDYLTDTIRVPTYVARLDTLVPPARKVREAIGKAKLVVITATDELDGLCERGNVAMARRLMDDVLLQIRRGLRVLFDLGVQTAIVTADHGYVFGETLASGDAIDAPGGQTVDLHRRVWVGKGGAASPSYLRVRADETGMKGDLELALPWTLAGFKAPGAGTAYLHGGGSPQELLIPVWTVRPAASVGVPPSSVAWSLTLGSPKISTRFLSVQIEARSTGLFEILPPVVQVEVREGSNRLSRSVASSYGFEESTGAVKMAVGQEGSAFRPNTVTLMLEETPKGGSVDVLLLDATTDRVVASLKGVPVALAAF